ncbi:MAG: isoprenylcysteine carboxylmethyltransferase family protein [candidate division KSB1 bacterium]|nr:isoprenylcysteine carboxylmethyltransferase family protein [candidate division KSB1 bacterium]MDZ7301079.1 isoprenylcysteine carboxylmethyltransferase family protein [candidate division KSB1 bacterium]MDZ7312097.1 isoprenylcysteine carboxylmethyltransferase family protein [candidate division KSB1 bacterium]
MQNTPLLWGFLAATFLTRLAEAFSPAANTLRSYRKEEDQARWTTGAIGLSFFTNVIAPMLEYRYKLWPELPATQWWNWVGLLVMLAGSAMRVWSIYQAGPSFIPHVTVDPKLKLVTAGPYAHVRHPWYLGTICSYLGIAMLFGSVIAAVALVVLVIPSLILRIVKEEQLLSGRFGESWKKYQSRTPWRLVPSLW